MTRMFIMVSNTDVCYIWTNDYGNTYCNWFSRGYI